MNSSDIDIHALAELAHIELSDSDVEALTEDISGILSLVEGVQNVEVGDEWRNESGAHSVMREDGDAYISGTYTEALLDAAPKRTGDHVEVKQVLSHVKKGGTA